MTMGRSEWSSALLALLTKPASIGGETETPLDGGCMGDTPLDGGFMGDTPLDGGFMGETPLDGGCIGDTPLDGGFMGDTESPLCDGATMGATIAVLA